MVVVPEDELFTGDVLIFCASRGIPPVEPGSKTDVRMAQLDANRDIIRHYAGLARNARYQGWYACQRSGGQPVRGVPE